MIEILLLRIKKLLQKLNNTQKNDFQQIIQKFKESFSVLVDSSVESMFSERKLIFYSQE